MKKINQGEEYIQAFPKFKRWINECICCHTKGYDPSMPEQIGEGLGAYYIKKYFNPLSLNKDGICEVCQHLIKKHNNWWIIQLNAIFLKKKVKEIDMFWWCKTFLGLALISARFFFVLTKTTR